VVQGHIIVGILGASWLVAWRRWSMSFFPVRTVPPSVSLFGS
jgi:hypothetical protein